MVLVVVHAKRRAEIIGSLKAIKMIDQRDFLLKKPRFFLNKNSAGAHIIVEIAQIQFVETGN